MGLTINFLSLLTNTKNRGVDFGNMAVLGRQFLYTDRFELFKILGKNTSNAVLTNSNGYADYFYEHVLEAKKVTTFDISNYEGADILHDFNEKLPDNLYEKYDVFLESGSLEHVFNFPTAISNCMLSLKKGGYFIGIFPTNNFCGHGFYQFSPELFFRIFSKENGFSIEEFKMFSEIPFSKVYNIHDPKELNQRMDFCNSTPLYLFVVAKRIEIVEIFSSTPLQSDYVVAWSSDNLAKKKIVFKYQIFNDLKDLFNKYFRRKRKYLYRIILRKVMNFGDLSKFFYSKND